ncbi:MAG: TylF/MycF/NovP-related O-methyltransferase [Burkholderiales bacterium]
MLEQARALASRGRPADALALLQSLVVDSRRSPELRDLRSEAFDGLLQLLFASGRHDRMAKVFGQYVTDYCDVQDAAFDQAYLAGVVASGTAPVPMRRRDRFRLLVQQFERTHGLPGSIAECGCFRGLSSFLLCSALRRRDASFTGAGYRIFDSFQGLSAPRTEDLADDGSEEFRRLKDNIVPGHYAASLASVRRTLAAFPGIEYFPGWIPAAFPVENSTRYRFVHVDVDLYQPTLDCFEYFWPRLVPGAVMVCDDYNWPGGRQAVEEFCPRAGVQFETSAFNQAYIVKPA